MASQQPANPIFPPPVPPASPPSTGVRRHHTISASSRRVSSRSNVTEESPEQQVWNDDEVVDQDWVGGVGVVGGEKGGLHRQSSLPSRYHRAFQSQSSRQPGNMTPRTMNSLSAIAGHEGDEEDWEREMRGLQNEEEAEHAARQQLIDAHSQSNNASPLSPHFGPTSVPPAPPAASGVRRHQSLTYGPAGGNRQISSSLKRSGTLQASIRNPSTAEDHHSPSPPKTEEEYADDGQGQPYDDESYFARSPPPQQQQYQATSPMGRQSPWSTPGEWRSPGSNSGGIDDVQRALSALEIAGSPNQLYQTSNNIHNQNNYQQGQSTHPPRFNPNQPPPNQAAGMRSNNNGGQPPRQLQPLVTEFDGRKTPTSQGNQGPVSASAYVPPIGHHPSQQQQMQPRGVTGQNNLPNDRALTVTGTTTWDQKERLLGSRTSNPNLQYLYNQGQPGRPDANVPNVPPIPTQYLQQQQPGMGQGPRLGAPTQYNSVQASQGQQGNAAQAQPGFANSPIDVPSLIASKGYNPSNFDVRPTFARFFVIKSYTEDDVHKSLKYEIWSSTDPGNKRLDKAFKECAGRGPIYLFFSVNTSGHFCGMAEMLTPVDYTRSSTVWASDKWKGVFKVRWVFVRDIPNATLRHIRLNNTQERKPVTNSRDTQELLPDAGQEMLRIFSTHPARTSLLQDFAFYELQAMQKMQGPAGTANSSEGSGSAAQQQQQQQQQFMSSPAPQQSPYAMTNPSALYPLAPMPQMNPMMQMQMNMPMAQYSMHPAAQTQAMHQSVMRQPSPVPVPGGQQGYMPPNF